MRRSIYIFIFLMFILSSCAGGRNLPELDAQTDFSGTEACAESSLFYDPERASTQAPPSITETSGTTQAHVPTGTESEAPVETTTEFSGIPATSATTGVTSANPSYPPAEPPRGGIAAGYYAGWAAYSGYTPLDIPADKLTHVFYAFADIGENLKIKPGDPEIDFINFSRLAALKASHPKLKILISVGGWTWSKRFSDAALTDTSRRAFADSAADFIIKYGFDGVDIDWEYPVGGGMAQNTYRPEDKTNFTLLMKALRERLDAAGAQNGRRYLLSFAGGAGGMFVRNTQLASLAGYVDFAVIMTYDLNGVWGSYTGFNSPLYGGLSVDSCVRGWVGAGFPKEKLVLGIPFYGHIFNGVSGGENGLGGAFSGGGSLSYDKIRSAYLPAPGYIRFFCSQARVPWLYNGQSFISYDDACSIREKASYAAKNELAGVCAWELSQNRSDELINAVNFVFAP